MADGAWPVEHARWARQDQGRFPRSISLNLLKAWEEGGGAIVSTVYLLPQSQDNCDWGLTTGYAAVRGLGGATLRKWLSPPGFAEGPRGRMPHTPAFQSLPQP